MCLSQDNRWKTAYPLSHRTQLTSEHEHGNPKSYLDLHLFPSNLEYDTFFSSFVRSWSIAMFEEIANDFFFSRPKILSYGKNKGIICIEIRRKLFPYTTTDQNRFTHLRSQETSKLDISTKNTTSIFKIIIKRTTTSPLLIS